MVRRKGLVGVLEHDELQWLLYYTRKPNGEPHEAKEYAPIGRPLRDEN
jgi:hypothetical protein